MKKLKLYLSIITLGLTSTSLLAQGNLAKQEPITVNLTMSEFKFEPKNLVFETGKLYKLVIKNIGKVKHEIDSASISHLAYTRKIQMLDKNGGLIAEVKGVPAEIEVGPGHEVEWWFVPVATTSGAEEVVCLLPGHFEAGMHGTFTFK